MATNDALVQATATILAARISSRASGTSAPIRQSLEDQFVQTYREIEAALKRINSEDALAGAR
jgi:hypothetical protein